MLNNSYITHICIYSSCKNCFLEITITTQLFTYCNFARYSISEQYWQYYHHVLTTVEHLTLHASGASIFVCIVRFMQMQKSKMNKLPNNKYRNNIQDPQVGMESHVSCSIRVILAFGESWGCLWPWLNPNESMQMQYLGLKCILTMHISSKCDCESLCNMQYGKYCIFGRTPTWLCQNPMYWANYSLWPHAKWDAQLYIP